MSILTVFQKMSYLFEELYLLTSQPSTGHRCEESLTLPFQQIFHVLLLYYIYQPYLVSWGQKPTKQQMSSLPALGLLAQDHTLCLWEGMKRVLKPPNQCLLAISSIDRKTEFIASAFKKILLS